MKKMTDYHKNLPQRVEKMLSDGSLPAKVRASLRMSKRQWEKFYESEPEFRDAVDIGMEACEATWAEIPSRGTYPNGEEFNKQSQTSWIFTMKNVFEWTDRRFTESFNTGQYDITSISQEELDQSIEMLMRESIDSDSGEVH